MKLTITLVLLLYFSNSFCQWTRIRQLPSSDILSLYHKDNVLYAGGTNIIYFSTDKGQTWDSTNTIPQFTSVSSITVYKNELYATSFSNGVFKSSNSGGTWQNISAGIFPDVSDITEWRGDLYAATLGGSIFKLDPINRDNWLSFSNGLSSLSANCTSIASNNNALVGGTLANALYDYLPANSTTWEERFLLGQLTPTEGVYDIITGHDSLFLAGHTGRFYMSTDNGLNWNTFGNILPSLNSTLVNAKQALLLSRSIFDGVNFHTAFYYIKKSSLQSPFINFSFVQDNLTYKLEIFGNNLWDASSKGLFFMSISDLPGISDADDSVSITLPVRFISFNANCEGNRVLLTWKTAQEQNSNHFNIERSSDAVNWTVIGNLPAAGNSNTERSYSFSDNSPLQNGFYRIAEIAIDGRAHYSVILSSNCSSPDVFRVWPNPVRDILSINIAATSPSAAMIKIVDSKGSLVKIQSATVLPRNNQLSVDMQSLVNGLYSLSVYWNNGQSKKTMQILKQ